MLQTPHHPTPNPPTHLTHHRKHRHTKKSPPTCITHIAHCIQQTTERINPLATAPWHDMDLDKLKWVHTFLPTNVTGKSVKEQWSNNHTEFIAENEDNPEFLTIYTDGSLTHKEGRRLTGCQSMTLHIELHAFLMHL